MPNVLLTIPQVSFSLNSAIRVCPAPTTPLFSDLNATLVSILAPLTAAARASDIYLPPWQPTLARVEAFASSILAVLGPLNHHDIEAQKRINDFIQHATLLHHDLDSRGLYTAFVPSYAQQRLWEKIATLLEGPKGGKYFGQDGDKLQVIFRSLDTFYDAMDSILDAQHTLGQMTIGLARFVSKLGAEERESDGLHLSPGTLHTPITVTRFVRLRRRINGFLNGPELPELHIDDGRAVVKLFHLLWNGGDLSVEPDDVDPEKEYMKRILDFDLSGSDIGFPTTKGASTFSVVYEATFKVPDDDWAQALWRTRVAVKMFLPGAISVEREPYFRQASLRIHTFSHPCLLMVHMTHWPQGVTLEALPGEKGVKDVFVVSELMTHNLRAARHSPALASPRTRLKILADIAAALAYLHGMGVAHMGIIPENILVRLEGSVVYGHAKLDVSNLFKHALFPGWREMFMNHQWLYRPPEKFQENSVFFTADSWSFGVLACFLMSDGAEKDERFYSGQTCSKSHRKLMKAWCNTITNEPLSVFIMQCLRENPEDRPVAAQVVEKMNTLLQSMYRDDDDACAIPQQTDIVANGTGSRANGQRPFADSLDFKPMPESSSDFDVNGEVISFGPGRNSRKRRANDASTAASKRRRINGLDSADPDWSATSGQASKVKVVTGSSSTGTHAVDGSRKQPGTRRTRRKSSTEVESQSVLTNGQPGMEVETAEVTSIEQESRSTRKISASRRTSQKRSRSGSRTVLPKRDSNVHSQTDDHPGGSVANVPNSNGVWSDEDHAVLIERTPSSQPDLREETPQLPKPPRELTAAEIVQSEQDNARGEQLQESNQPNGLEQAAAFFKKAADAGNTKAQVNYGHCLEYGRGVQQNFGEAAYYFQVAAERCNPQAQLKIGLCHEFGRGTKKDYKVAVDWYKKAASLGNTQAQLNLGIAYQHGRGLPEDHVKAAELYSSAAASGLVAAQLNLGVLYEEGKGLPRDAGKAFKLYEQAAVGGSNAAMLNLAVCYQRGRGCEKNAGKAAIMFMKAADRDNTAAMYKAGQCFENGEGVQVDYTRAAIYYRRAAEADDLGAMYNLGRFYLKGIGVEKDARKSFMLFEASSKNGHIPATVMLGWCYDNGKGVKESVDKAVACYRKAEQHGNPRAKVFLGYKYEMGRGVKMNKNTAVRLYRESASAGCPKGETALGQCYQFGYGMPKCVTTAVSLYEKAVEKGDDGACEELGKLCRDGTDIEQDEKKAFACFELGAEAGNVTCVLNMAEFLYYGKGTEKDVVRAVAQFKKAASMGSAEGFRWLGDCYSEGCGVEADSVKATDYFQKGAQLGSSVAQTSLGNCFEFGHGVEVNGARAVEWYRKAANGGNLTAMNNLGILYEKGKFVRQDYTKAFKVYHKARNGGNIESVCNLADCYAFGHGVAKSVGKAFELYQEAADLGVVGAQCELGACYYYGKGVEVDFSKAIELFHKAEKSEPEAVRHLGTAYFDGNGVAQDFNKALQLFVKAAQDGNSDAYLNVGICHEYGNGVERDVVKAADFYRLAMDNGNKTAARLLGNLYMEGCGVVKDVSEAVRLFREFPLNFDEIMS